MRDSGAGEQPAADLVPRFKSVAMPEFGVVVFESRHPPGFASLALEPDLSQFLLVRAGHSRLEGGGRVFHLGPGSLVHTPAKNSCHIQAEPGQPVTWYTIQYREEILPASLVWRLGRLGMLHWNVHRAGSPLLRTLPSICNEMHYEQRCHQIGWESVLVARLVDLVVCTTRFGARQAPHYPPSLEKLSDSAARVSRYATRLRSEFYLPTTLDDAARATGLSRRRFTALFRSSTGQSWHKYLLGLRLNHARQLLSHTDNIILSVAFESGFDDLSHFNHVFRQVVGCSPSAFRARRSEDRGQAASDGSPLREDNLFKEAAFSAAIPPGPWMARQQGFRT
jgi:AraC-like DNA-binding protein